MIVAFLLIASVLNAADAPVDFDSQVLPVLTHAGCNAGACHGAAAGRGGLHLSLFGSDPDADYSAIVRFAEGRRINLFNTLKSLVLMKPLGILEHGGGTVFDEESSSVAILRSWLEQGAKRGVKRQLQQLRVSPAEANATTTGQPIPLRAIATFSDGVEADVSEWTIFHSDDPASVEVTSRPLQAVCYRPGKHMITARFWNKIVPVSIVLPYQLKNVNAKRSTEASRFIDAEIDSTLDQLGLVGNAAAHNGSLLRRLRLDLTGRLPTLVELDAFQSSSASDRREQQIEQLLASDDFSEFWSLRLARWLRLRGSLEEPQAAVAYGQWIRNSLESRRPYDEMVRELLTATGDSHGLGATNFTRTAKDARLHAELVGSVFMGTRIQCANCHKHPFASWTQDDYHGLAAVFAKLDRGRFVAIKKQGAVTNPRTGESAVPRIPGLRDVEGADAALDPFVNWLLQADNPHFAKATVNWLWDAMMGRGLVVGVDDFRETNPPTHARLLEMLADDFVAHGYDLRRTLRWIANSDAYARAAGSQSQAKELESWYGTAISKPLLPEVLLDAIDDVLLIAMDEGSYPKRKRAIEILDPVIPSPDLDALGRCSRSENCQSTSQQLGLASKLQAINGGLLNQRISDPDGRLKRALAGGLSIEEIIVDFYRRALAKKPSDKQLSLWRNEYNGMSREAESHWIEDFVWAILSSEDFASNR